MSAAEMPCGWSGKLPCRGDFIEGGARLDLFDWFAGWASEGAAAVRAGGGALADAFLTAPLVRFAAAPGVVGRPAALGVLGPGMDRAGRLYPFLIAAELAEAQASGPDLQANAEWFDKAEAAFLDFLAPDFDAALIAERLADLPSFRPVADSPGDTGMVWCAGDAQAEAAASVPDMTTVMGLPVAKAAFGGQVG